MWTNVWRVRRESWFEWNENVEDYTIEDTIEEAHSEILTTLKSKYDIKAFNQNFQWSSTQKILTNIETLLSACYVLNREIIPTVWEEEPWLAKCRRAQELLDKILSWDIVLLDNQDNEYLTASTWLTKIKSVLWPFTKNVYFNFSDRF